MTFPPTWYSAYFPDCLLWNPIPQLNIPAFYALFVGISLLVSLVVKARES